MTERHQEAQRKGLWWLIFQCTVMQDKELEEEYRYAQNNQDSRILNMSNV